MGGKHLSGRTFTIIFLILFYLIWLMIKSYLNPLVFAGILAGSLYPLFNKFHKFVRLGRFLSSGLFTFLITLVIIFPTLYLSWRISLEVVNFYPSIKSMISEENIRNFLFGESWLAQNLRSLFTNLKIEYSYESLDKMVLSMVQKGGISVVNFLNIWFSDIFTFIYNFIMMLLMIFVFFLEGPNLKIYVQDLIPLPNEQEEYVLNKFNQMNYTTLLCNGVGGLIQGFLAGIAFFIVGIPSPILWSAVLVILAFIPLVGISLVTLPVSVYLFFQGHYILGPVFLVYCSLVAFFTENWFKPKFIGNRVQINSVLVFLSVIGGMSAFGLAGIFYGPIVTTLFLTVVEIYENRVE